jgi:hypothetical protein
MVLYTLQSSQNTAYAHAAIHRSLLQGLRIVAAIKPIADTLSRGMEQRSLFGQ